jgi:hypothetical protein
MLDRTSWRIQPLEQTNRCCFSGDDAGAKGKVKQLADELGFEGVDAGPLTQARLLEPFALLWISLALKQGLGREIAFKLLRR